MRQLLPDTAFLYSTKGRLCQGRIWQGGSFSLFFRVLLSAVFGALYSFRARAAITPTRLDNLDFL